MGGKDLTVIYQELQEQQDRERRLRQDLRKLAADYPEFLFAIVAGGGKTGIEAVPRPGYDSELWSIVMPDAGSLREALNTALDDPIP
jgi:hypothetical protein